MSHILCSAEVVAAAARSVIATIEAHRSSKDETMISRKMSKKRYFWSRSTRTREEAIKDLDQSNMFGWRSNYAWEDLDAARGLLLLSKHGDPVVVDVDSARVLWRNEI